MMHQRDKTRHHYRIHTFKMCVEPGQSRLVLYLAQRLGFPLLIEPSIFLKRFLS